MPPCRLQFSWLLIKRMGKETMKQHEKRADEPKLLENENSADEPKLLDKENSADEPNLLGRLTGKILETIDFHELSDSVADQLGERIASKIQTCDLVDRLLEKYQLDIQAAVVEALVQRL